MYTPSTVSSDPDHRSGRLAQASGIRYIGFRHESDAGHARPRPAFLTKKPGICLTVSAPGFLNGLVALANATTNCFPMVQISGSSERHLVDLQRGDYEEMDQLAAAKMFAKAAYRSISAPRTSAAVLPVRSAPRCPAVPEASTSTSRPRCSAR
jgi:thiamine pyrophosphate-dependent acetolactate synthase large subunit-like protein